jgi:hypothetical protein
LFESPPLVLGAGKTKKSKRNDLWIAHGLLPISICLHETSVRKNGCGMKQRQHYTGKAGACDAFRRS